MPLKTAQMALGLIPEVLDAPRGRPARAAATSWRVYRLRLVLPMVGRKIFRDHRERQPKGYTRHEVTAPRAVVDCGGRLSRVGRVIGVE
jgi:hypothetical protein